MKCIVQHCRAYKCIWVLVHLVEAISTANTAVLLPVPFSACGKSIAKKVRTPPPFLVFLWAISRMTWTRVHWRRKCGQKKKSSHDQALCAACPDIYRTLWPVFVYRLPPKWAPFKSMVTFSCGAALHWPSFRVLGSGQSDEGPRQETVRLRKL